MATCLIRRRRRRSRGRRRSGQRQRRRLEGARRRVFASDVSADPRTGLFRHCRRRLGPGVDDLKVGDAVFGVLDAGREGAYCREGRDQGVDHRQKARCRFPISTPPRWRSPGSPLSAALEDTLKLKRGEKILIQGGAGGVASFAIQLAKHIGAHVITTTSTANIDYVRGLGADEVIDYSATDFTSAVANCDAVFDTVGGDVAIKSFAVLKPGGRAAFIASGWKAPKPTRDDVTSLRPNVGRARAPLERIGSIGRGRRGASARSQTLPPVASAEAHRLSEVAPLSRQACLSGPIRIKAARTNPRGLRLRSGLIPYGRRLCGRPF